MHPLLLAALVGAGIGSLERTGSLDQLPRPPLVGRTGALAIGAMMLAPTVPLARLLASGAALLAGHQWATTGRVIGNARPPSAW